MIAEVQLHFKRPQVQNPVLSTCGLVAMTPAQHAEGRQFGPGQVYERRQDVALRLWGAGGGLWKWCNVCCSATHNHGGSAWHKYGRWRRGKGVVRSVLVCFSP